jgi:hypothetical protein
MSVSLRHALAAGAFAVLSAAPAALHAQAPAADSLAFPREFVKWVLSAKGDSAWAHAGPKLRESMKSAQGVNDMAMRVVTRFGQLDSTMAEVQVDEGPLKVYIAAMKFSQVPDAAAWVVVYDPATKMADRASFGPLARAKASYPTAKLP